MERPSTRDKGPTPKPPPGTWNPKSQEALTATMSTYHSQHSALLTVISLLLILSMLLVNGT